MVIKNSTELIAESFRCTFNRFMGSDTVVDVAVKNVIEEAFNREVFVDSLSNNLGSRYRSSAVLDDPDTEMITVTYRLYKRASYLLFDIRVAVINNAGLDFSCYQF